MQCPYCKEEIHDEAVKCKHCGSNLSLHLRSRQPAAGADEFAESFTATFKLWKDNLSDLIVLTLVFLMICWIPVVNTGFIAGYTRSLTRVHRGLGRAAVGDLFSSWDCFGRLFTYLVCYLAATFILHFVPVIGSFASMALGLLVMPGTLAIIDRGMGPVEALTWSIDTIRNDLLNWFLVYLVSSMLVLAGFMGLVICSLLTVPFAQLLVIRQYEKLRTP